MIVFPDPITRTVLLSEIDRTYPAQLRAKEEADAITDYSAAMLRGDEFPMPVLVTSDEGYIVVDGHHRVKAAAKAGIDRLPCSVVSTPVDVDAAEYACLLAIRCNNQNGVRKTQADRRAEQIRTIPLLAKVGLSNRDMARMLKCDEATIRTRKKELRISPDRDNKLRWAVGLGELTDQTEQEVAELTSQVSPLQGDAAQGGFALAPNVSKVIAAMVKRNAKKLEIKDVDAVAIFMAAGALMSRMANADCCAIANALYQIGTQRAKEVT